MNRLEKVAMIRKRRQMNALESQKLALEAGLNEQETKDYLFHTDSNAIWDGEANRPYRSPSPPVIKKRENMPVYSEKEFCDKFLNK